MDYENSDVDSKLIVTPSISDLIDSKQPTSKVFVRDNDEHIDFKDIRNIISSFKKQNMNFLEILFTNYYIINPIYNSLWLQLVNNRELISHISIPTSLNAMVGVASDKFFALTHHYPSRMYYIDKFGYDPKQLHHLLRVQEFMRRFIDGEPYNSILYPSNPEFLISVKKGDAYNLQQAITVATDTYNNIQVMRNNYLNNNPSINTINNSNIINLLDSIQHNILLSSVLNESSSFVT